MIKCKKDIKRKPSRFKIYDDPVSNDVKQILHSSYNVESRCSCGCSRPVKSIQSILLKNYLCSKKRWITLLGVRKNRIFDLSSFSEIILGMENTHDFNALDLNLVKSDTSRQQWLLSTAIVFLVEKAIYTFCLYNHVAYWQGIHDVAAALARLEPTPSVGELAALLERLVQTYAPILFSNSASEVGSKANELSLKWRLLFKYFFPKASYDYDQFCESSFSVGWFMTLGFYRFGCAYICLAYTFLLIISRHDCLSSFMFRELGYIAARGYINYLNSQRISVDFNNSVIFSNFSNSSLIVNTLVNSNKIVLESEEFINISKNLYDTFNGRDFELAEYPLLYIFKASNILQNSAPSVLKADSQKDFIEITEPDLFAKKNRLRLMEPTARDNPNSFTIKYRSRKSFRLNRSRLRRSFFTHRNSICTISDLLNAELMYSYISSFKRFGCLRRVGGTATTRPSAEDNFVYGNVLNPNILYNVLDLRSLYLCSGMSLDKIFGNSKTTFLKAVNAHEAFESCLLDTTFSMWIVLTDQGYEVEEDDDDAILSLNRGLEAMHSLSRNSVTCVTMFRGGYKAMLRALNLPVPETPSLLSRIGVRRFLPWRSGVAPEATTPSNISSFAASIGSAALGIENRIVKGISDMSIFSRFRHTQPQVMDNIIERVERLSLTSRMPVSPYYSNYTPPKISYCIKLSTQAGPSISVRSNGRIKINGMILHPYKYDNAVADPNVSILICLSTLFSVNCVDALLDVECKSYSFGKLNTESIDYFKQTRDNILSVFSVVICTFGTHLLDLTIKPFTLVTNVAGVCSNVRLDGIHKKWNIFIIKRERLINHLLKCLSIDPPHDAPPDPFTSDANDTNNSATNLVVPYITNTGVAGTSVHSKISSQNPTFRANGLFSNKLIPGRTVYRLNDQRTIKVFSRTHESRTHDSTGRSTVSNFDARLVPNNPTPLKQIPIFYNNNVFVSRSSLNKRQNSKR